MPLKPIKSESIISVAELDRRDAARQAGVKTVDVSNLPDGFQPGESISVNQVPAYKTNIEKHDG